MTQPLLEGRSLVKAFGHTPALRGAHLSLGEGEVVALSGRSGGGKSTLLHCLAGILRPDAGTVRYRDLDLHDADDRTLSHLRRTEFGVLFQFGQLVPELTAEDNVGLPLLLAGRPAAAARTAALTWLDRFGVADLAGDRPGEMSGGQAQRVAAARALVTEPRVVFADEPTGALDTVTGERVLTQLLRVVQESGTALLLVTHEPRIAAHAHREVVLQDGVVEPSGVPA